MNAAQLYIHGAIMMANAVVALFFYFSWKRTTDRLFILFAAAFLILAIERILIAFTPISEHQPLAYLSRLLAHGLILGAIWDKNRT